MTTTRSELRSTAAERPPALGDTQFKPVYAWAAVGAGCVILFAYLIVMWFVSGDAKPTPAGDVETYTLVAARIWEIAQVIGVPLLIYRVVIKPWRRDHNLSTDGVMCLAFFTLWWQDTVCNSLAGFTYSSAAFLNLGSWDRHIPFWVAPNGNKVVEPPLGSSGIMYFWCPLAIAVVGCYVMRRAKQRWPSIGVFRQLALCWAAIGVVTGIGEMIVLRLGLWAYQGAHSGVTLFHGRFYQYPLYEGLLLGLVGTAWAAIRFFRNDKGQTIAERGLENVVASARKRNLLRVLALGGVLNVAFLLLWQLPMAHIAAVQDPWPEDIVKRKHLTNSVCGPGTGYACPGPEIPLNRKGSIHIGPDGEFVVPEGTRLPAGGTTSDK